MIYECPKCKGKGYIWDTSGAWVAGLFTCGIIPFIEAIRGNDEYNRLKDDCCACGTKGYIKE